MSDIRPRLPFSVGSVVTVIFRVLSRLLRIKPVWMIGSVALVVYLFSESCSTYVPPNMIGLRQVYYGSGAGIKPEQYGPGLHFIAAGVERLHLFPRDIQLINYTDTQSESSSQFRAVPSIKIQTSDGYNVQLDVSVIYHIVDAYKIFTEAGPGRAFEDRLVIPRVDRTLRKTLGELNSEEFYQGPRRIEKSNAAHKGLAEDLKQYGIEVDAVLVRKYQYDEKYQLLIQGRKIKDQTVFLRQAEAKAAIEQRIRDTAIAEGKATQEIELARGQGEMQKLNAQADLYKRKKAAEGKLLVELAEAKGAALNSAALQGAGSENMVGLKMAEVLKGLKVVVIPSDGKDGMNPLDLAGMLKKFEVR